jgi:hypothetical protein
MKVAIHNWEEAPRILGGTHHKPAIRHNRLCELHIQILLVRNSCAEFLLA